MEGRPLRVAVGGGVDAHLFQCDQDDLIESLLGILSNLNYSMTRCVVCGYAAHEDDGIWSGSKCDECGEEICTECISMARMANKVEESIETSDMEFVCADHGEDTSKKQKTDE